MKAQALSFVLTMVTVLSAQAVQQTMSAGAISGGSADNRVGKNMMLTAQLIGAGATDSGKTPIAITQGLNLGFYLTSDTILSLGVESGHGSVGDTLIFSDRNRTVDTRALNVSLKKFVGNSFYLRGGAEARTVDYKQHDKDIPIFGSTTYESDRSFKGEMIAGTLALGNQWQFSGFTLGADWFGVTIPVSNNVKNETANINGTPGDYDQLRYDDAKKSLTEVHYEVCRFYLGASF